MHTLQMSLDPIHAIARAMVNLPGNSGLHNVPAFRKGYEYTLNAMPDFTHPDTAPTPGMVDYAAALMRGLATDLGWGGWVHDITRTAQANTVSRTILGIDHNGPEIVVGTWGRGFEAVAHGHAAGFLNDILLTGKLLSSTYRLVAPDSNVVRTVETKILTPMDTMLKPQYHTRRNVYCSDSLMSSEARTHLNNLDRSHGIHSFNPLENSSSLHFVPEHPRDGVDNTFQVEHFEIVWHLNSGDFDRLLTDDEIRELKVGDVVLTRNMYGSDLGDHYTVITGPPILATWGVRKLTGVTIQAPKASFLNFFQDLEKVNLQLNPEMARRFRQFHGITIANGKVQLPEED